MKGPVICGYRCRGLWWFRVLGYGIHWKDARLYPPLFSERKGYDRRLKVGPWRFKTLRPDAPAGTER